MSFKDMNAEDLDVFMDPEEFGEEVIINGTPFIAIRDEETKDITGAYNEELKEGVYKKITTLYIKTSDLGESYEQGKNLTVNDFPYIVHSSSEQDGLTKIELEENAVW